MTAYTFKSDGLTIRAKSCAPVGWIISGKAAGAICRLPGNHGPYNNVLPHHGHERQVTFDNHKWWLGRTVEQSKHVWWLR